MTKVIILTMMAVITAKADNPQYALPVCADLLAAGPAAFQAKFLAASMFADAGVLIHWYAKGDECPQDAIVVRLGTNAPASMPVTALAYARPFSSPPRIEIFLDRVRSLVDARRVYNLLAHVLVHEITHVLQRSDRHADRGVMKAMWSRKELEEMARGRLPLTPQDVIVLRFGLASRRGATSVAAVRRLE